MSQLCPACNHDNPGKEPGGRCVECGEALRELLGLHECISKYEVQKVLGCGGFSAVYLAVDVQSGRTVALKEMFSLDTEDAQRFEHEASILRRLSHPQLPKFYESLEHAGRRYLAMEYIEGQSLAEIVRDKARRREKVRETVALGWGLQLCDALEYLHGEGVIHRDVKPDNVRLTPDGEIYLVDLGIAKKLAPSGPSMTVVHAATVGYAPIEQYSSRTSRYQGRTGVLTDIYALGATLYTVVTNQVPPDARMLKAQIETLVPIQAINPRISDRFAMTVERAMAIEPEDRFRSMAEMSAAFRGERPAFDDEEKPVAAPFRFGDGREAHSLAELVQMCDERWPEARQQLYQGHIGRWDGLRPAHQDLADRARQIVETQADRDLGLDAWLEAAAAAAGLKRSPPAPVLTVQPAPPLDLGRVSAERWALDAPLQVRLELRGSRSRRSRVRCAPWLSVNPAEIAWPDDGLTTLSIGLKPETALPPGEHTVPEAVWLETDRQTQPISARISVEVPVSVEVSPGHLDLGTGTARTLAAGQLTLRNPGAYAWEALVEAVDWLEVDPRAVECLPRGERHLRVTLSAQALAHPGEYQDQAALTVHVGERAWSVPVRAVVVAPTRLRPVPAALDLGIADAAHLPTATLALHPDGSTPWLGALEVNAHWLSITGQAQSAAEPGVTILSITPRREELSHPGLYEDKAALVIRGEGQEEAVPARLQVPEARLELAGAELDFGTVHDVSSAVPKGLFAHNPSFFAWQGRVRCAAAWLRAEPAQVTCEPGKSVEIRVHVVPEALALPAGASRDPAALLLEGMGQSYPVAACLTIAPRPQQQIEIAPAVADFGAVPSWDAAIPQRIVLSNTGSEPLSLSVGCVLSWLDVQPRSLWLAPGARGELVVQLTRNAGHLRRELLERPEAIVLSGAGADRPIGVRLVHGEALPAAEPQTINVSPIGTRPVRGETPPVVKPEPVIVRPPEPVAGVVVEPATLDFGQVGIVEGQSLQFRITNHTGSALTGVVTCPPAWLECLPAVLTCARGETVTLTAKLMPAANRLRPGHYARDKADDAISIRCQPEGGAVVVPVRLTKL